MGESLQGEGRLKVGVVLPSYNHAHYIGEALRSVLEQSYAPELVVVLDDGSTDETQAVVEGFAEQGVQWKAQENAGAHVTINRLMAEVAPQVDVVAILNTDDVYLPARLEAGVQALLERPEKSVVCTSLELFDDDGEVLIACPASSRPLVSHSRAKWYQAVWSLQERFDKKPWQWLGVANFLASTSNVMMRSDYALAHPFANYRFAHDYDFLIEAALQDALMVLPQAHFRYRVHASNTITTKPKALMSEMLRVVGGIYERVGAGEIAGPGVRQRFQEFARELPNSVSAFDNGIFRELVGEEASAIEAGRSVEKGWTEKLQDEALAAHVEESKWERFPNGVLVNRWSGEGDVLEEAEANRAAEQAKQQQNQEEKLAKREEKAAKVLGRVEEALGKSRWLKLGSVFGVRKFVEAKGLHGNEEVLEEMKRKVEASKWFQFGVLLGSKRCRRLMEVLEGNHR